MHKVNDNELFEAYTKQSAFGSIIGKALGQPNDTRDFESMARLKLLDQVLLELQEVNNKPVKKHEQKEEIEEEDEEEQDVVQLLAKQIYSTKLNIDFLKDSMKTKAALSDLQNKERKIQQKDVHKAIQRAEAILDIMDQSKHDGRDLVRFCLKNFNGFLKQGEGKYTFTHYTDNEIKCLKMVTEATSAGNFASTKIMLNHIRDTPFTERVQEEALHKLATTTSVLKKHLQYQFDFLANKMRKKMKQLHCGNPLEELKQAMEQIFTAEQTQPEDRGVEHFIFQDFIRRYEPPLTEAKVSDGRKRHLVLKIICHAQILKLRCAVAGNFIPVAQKITNMRNSKCHWQTLWYSAHFFQESIIELVPDFWPRYNSTFNTLAQQLIETKQTDVCPLLHTLTAFRFEALGKISDDEYIALQTTSAILAASQANVKTKVDILLATVDRSIYLHNSQMKTLQAFNVIQVNDSLQFAFNVVQNNLGDAFTEHDVGALFNRWKKIVAPDFQALLGNCLEVIETARGCINMSVGMFVWQETEFTVLYYLHTNQEEKAIHFVNAFNDIVPNLVRRLEQPKKNRNKRLPTTILAALKEELRKQKELQKEQANNNSQDQQPKLSKNARKRLQYQQQRALEEKYAVDLSMVPPNIAIPKKELEQNLISHEERLQRKAELKAARVNNNSNTEGNSNDANESNKEQEQLLKPTYIVTKKEYEIFEGIINYSTKISSESAQFKSLMFKIFKMQFRQAKGSHCVGVSTGIRLPDLIDLGNGNIIPLSSFSTELKEAIVRGGDSNATWITTCSKYLKKYQLCQIKKSMFERGWALDTVSIV